MISDIFLEKIWMHLIDFQPKPVDPGWRDCLPYNRQKGAEFWAKNVRNQSHFQIKQVLKLRRDLVLSISKTNFIVCSAIMRMRTIIDWKNVEPNKTLISIIKSGNGYSIDIKKGKGKNCPILDRTNWIPIGIMKYMIFTLVYFKSELPYKSNWMSVSI